MFFYRFLPSDNNLEELNLSFNNDVTAISLRRFIQHKKPPKKLIFEGCDNIFRYLDESSSNIWSFDKSFPKSSLHSVTLSTNFIEKNKEVDFLSSVWEQEWGNKAKIQKLFNTFLHLSIHD